MAVDNGVRKRSIVLDTAALIAGTNSLFALCGIIDPETEEHIRKPDPDELVTFYTTPDVVQEVKDERARARLALLQGILVIRSPSSEAIAAVSSFSKGTGDYSVLSLTDLRVMALCWMLEVERDGGTHLRKQPKCLSYSQIRIGKLIPFAEVERKERKLQEEKKAVRQDSDGWSTVQSRCSNILSAHTTKRRKGKPNVPAEQSNPRQKANSQVPSDNIANSQNNNLSETRQAADGVSSALQSNYFLSAIDANIPHGSLPKKGCGSSADPPSETGEISDKIYEMDIGTTEFQLGGSFVLPCGDVASSLGGKVTDHTEHLTPESNNLLSSDITTESIVEKDMSKDSDGPYNIPSTSIASNECGEYSSFESLHSKLVESISVSQKVPGAQLSAKITQSCDNIEKKKKESVVLQPAPAREAPRSRPRRKRRSRKKKTSEGDNVFTQGRQKVDLQKEESEVHAEVAVSPTLTSSSVPSNHQGVDPESKPRTSCNRDVDSLNMDLEYVHMQSEKIHSSEKVSTQNNGVKETDLASSSLSSPKVVAEGKGPGEGLKSPVVPSKVVFTETAQTKTIRMETTKKKDVGTNQKNLNALSKANSSSTKKETVTSSTGKDMTRSSTQRVKRKRRPRKSAKASDTSTQDKMRAITNDDEKGEDKMASEIESWNRAIAEPEIQGTSTAVQENLIKGVTDPADVGDSCGKAHPSSADCHTVKISPESNGKSSGDEIADDENVEAKNFYSVNNGNSSDDDGSGWINPSNLEERLTHDAKLDTPSNGDELRVGCVTTDFAMQNTMLQMGLKILTVDGRRAIRRIKHFALRCSACGVVTRDFEKKFCDMCGNAAMHRVAFNVNKNGIARAYLNPRKSPNLRGTKYPIPKPRGGRHNNDLILRADQIDPVKQRRIQKRLDQQNVDVLDPTTFYNAGARFAPQEKPLTVGYGRRNPNEVRRSSRKKR